MKPSNGLAIEDNIIKKSLDKVTKKKKVKQTKSEMKIQLFYQNSVKSVRLLENTWKNCVRKLVKPNEVNKCLKS